jgi:transcriptional regulator with PAS, ATPase and Fis domain
VRDRQGRFELAHEGTILLDEVAEMTPEMQLHLLRILQEGAFERVGESLTRKVNVRVIAATNKDLSRAIAQREFREDLFYRLNVIPIHVPPLRERREDIPHLIQHFLIKFSLFYSKGIEEIEDDALDACLNYDWPGNVRELENNIEYAFARTRDEAVIKLAKLPPHLREKNSTPALRTIQPSRPEKATEADHLRAILDQYHWNRSKTAASLGMGRTTLWRKMRELGLEA